MLLYVNEPTAGTMRGQKLLIWGLVEVETFLGAGRRWDKMLSTCHSLITKMTIRRLFIGVNLHVFVYTHWTEKNLVRY